MEDQPSTTSSRSAWETLAQVYAGSRQVSPDKLIEWSAQRSSAGDFNLLRWILLLGVAELLLALWLVVIGVNVQRWNEQASAAGMRT